MKPSVAMFIIAAVFAPINSPIAHGAEELPKPGVHFSFIENGVIRLGVDLNFGGAIGYLAYADDQRNLINIHDPGRYVQQSYYSGPRPFGQPHPSWKNWSWNPIGAGDAYRHGAKVLELRNDGRELYVKTLPMQWALDNVPGDCAFEQWITLEGDVAHVRNRLTNHREDTTFYAARTQELPAVYTIGKLYRLITYDGDKPFTNDTLRQVALVGPPWGRWYATECWSALVDDDGRGVGLFSPGVYRFAGGFAGKPNAGGPLDPQTGHISGHRNEILDYNIVFEYRYALIVGTVDRIREHAYAHRHDGRPDYQFTQDRQSFTLRDAIDDGFPIRDGWRVRGAGDRPMLIGPPSFWHAADVPRLYLRAAFGAGAGSVRVQWTTLEDRTFSDDRSVSVTVRPDGQEHTYEVDLQRHAGYRGSITGVALQLSDAAAESAATIRWISWKPAGPQ